MPRNAPPNVALTPPDLAALGSDLRLSCMRISRRVRFENDDAVAPHQFSVLARLQEENELTPGQLAERERVTAPSMTKTLTTLVEAGLVARRACPDDGRQVKIQLTDRGRTEFESIRRHRDAWMIDRLAALDPDEQVLLQAAAQVLARIATQ